MSGRPGAWGTGDRGPASGHDAASGPKGPPGSVIKGSGAKVGNRNHGRIFDGAKGIELSGVCVRFGSRTVLDLSVGPITERRVGLLGCNGSGKSTFLRLLNGLVASASGTVCVDGLDVKSHKSQVRQYVGFVFQDPDAQIVMPTVAEEMELGLKALKLAADERQRRARTALRRFGLLGREEDSPHLLSGGEKQRLALACIYAMGPSILVMDEPSAMLDLRGRLELQQLIAELPQRVIIATHDFELIKEFERVLVLDEGLLLMDTTEPHEAIAAYKRRVMQPGACG